MKRLGVLVSGSGSNLQAIMDACAAGGILHGLAAVAVVISDRSDAFALERARRKGVEAVFLNPKGFDGRLAYMEALAAALRQRDVDLVCCAGFMRLLKGAVLEAFRGRIMNIHPALLPAFPGLNAQQQALDYGVKLAGCTVHFVDEGVDTGPIILQAAVPVQDDDDVDSLQMRILAEEHRIYPEAIHLWCRGALRLDGRRVRVDRVAAQR